MVELQHPFLCSVTAGAACLLCWTVFLNCELKHAPVPGVAFIRYFVTAGMAQLMCCHPRMVFEFHIESGELNRLFSLVLSHRPKVKSLLLLC